MSNTAWSGIYILGLNSTLLQLLSSKNNGWKQETVFIGNGRGGQMTVEPEDGEARGW